MADSTATLAIKIVTDAAGGQAGLKSAESSAGKLQKGLGKLVVPAAAVVTGIALIGKAAVDSASRTQQAMGAVDSVFGKSAGQIKKWSDQAADSVGLAKSEYGELASVIGAQLKNMGVPTDKLASQTNDLITKGADLAATFGGTTADAVAALGSALRGETDPIEKYGVSVKQADIAAQQAKEGTDKLTGSAGKQAKTMALLHLVNKQTADSTGQFSRESDSAAGAAQIQAAKVENLKSSLGQALLPVVAGVSDKLGELAGWMQKNTKLVQIIIGVLGALAVAVLVVNAAMKVYQATMVVVGAVQKATWLASPIGLVIIAVIALVAGMVLLYKKSATVRKIVDALWRGIKTGVKAAATVVKLVFKVAWLAVSTYVKAYWTVIKFVFNAIRTVVTAVAKGVRAAWSAVWSALRSAARAAGDVVRNVWQNIRQAASTAVDGVKSAFSGMWDKLKGSASGVASALSKPFDVVKSAIDKVIDAVQVLIGWLGKIKVPSIHLPKIPGVNLSSSAAPGVSTFAAPAVAGSSGGVSSRATAPVGGVNIVVNGALDPESVARQIKRILAGHDRRIGLRVT